jgi:anti-sigma B factor antagonist
MTEFPTHALDNGVQVVQAGQRLNMVTARMLTAVVSDLVAAGQSRVVVDLGGTAFIDSSGLGALVSCLKKARQAGGDLRIAGPTEQVQMVLELTNLNRVLQPSQTVEIASAAF